MSNVPTRPSLVHALAVLLDHLVAFPSQPVAYAADRLGLDLDALPPDLLDLTGAEACEALEAELVVAREGWALPRVA